MIKDNNSIVKLLPNEYWWGGAISDGIYMPYGSKDFEAKLNPNTSPNQAAPFLVSTKGRYLWSDQPFDFKIRPAN